MSNRIDSSNASRFISQLQQKVDSGQPLSDGEISQLKQVDVTALPAPQAEAITALRSDIFKIHADEPFPSDIMKIRADEPIPSSPGHVIWKIQADEPIGDILKQGEPGPGHVIMKIAADDPIGPGDAPGPDIMKIRADEPI